MNEETVGLDWEKEYEKLKHQKEIQLEEMAHEFKNKLDSERNTKNIIIEKQEKEIEFLKNIIKGILHF